MGKLTIKLTFIFLVTTTVKNAWSGLQICVETPNILRNKCFIFCHDTNAPSILIKLKHTAGTMCLPLTSGTHPECFILWNAGMSYFMENLNTV